ncbi:hypothetical protein ACFQZJ_14125 [Maribacter chungangensis]|uniref:Threonine synthase n=1 Tax=Maribacter chungangensis TaxID=1069117 RepID=A0ABW3B6Q6_9FLAO
MKKISLFALAAVLFACKTDKTKQQPMPEDVPVISPAVQNDYPETITKVFDAHGGLVTWKSFKTLSFTISKEESSETHTVALKSRKERITAPDFSTGFDGSEIWLLDEKGAYEGDAVFYHNLMFYFYAMPFVLADDGINYQETPPLAFEGTSYPGMLISYDAGIGNSPKDEYFLHYHPETFQMEWLGYTVTFRSGEKSHNVKWIRYNDWMAVDGLLLPKSITWYITQGTTLVKPRNTVAFENVSLSTVEKPAGFYDKPEKGVFVSGTN